MIKDSISNTATYHGIHPGIDKALRSIESGKFREWKIGRHDIDGDDIFCLIQEYESRIEGRLEAHNSYIDIQVVLGGDERIGYAERNGLTPDGNFDKSSDIGFFEGEGDPVYLKEGDFAVFFPGDGHAPGLRTGSETCKVRKAVFKIHV
ncbi:MAG: YhcH/YjgK/YiaL family protein [Spirochaetaceae bacterium]|nr:YhcH/YjgK/YiaL family protein [Spirochaetaceae bacterium]